jgi:hypothetical protein
MNNIPKEKKSQMILVGMVSSTLCFGLYFGIIQGQNDRITAMEKRRDEMVDKLNKAERALKNKQALETEIAFRRQELDAIEQTMASGDLYAWIIGSMNVRAAKFGLNIPTYGRESLGEIGIIPGFPYKAATFVLRGTGTFESLGLFISELENERPFCRVQNLDVSPSAPTATEPYPVQFSFEFVVPVRPTLNAIATNEKSPAKVN